MKPGLPGRLISELFALRPQGQRRTGRSRQFFGQPKYFFGQAEYVCMLPPRDKNRVKKTFLGKNCSQIAGTEIKN